MKSAMEQSYLNDFQRMLFNCFVMNGKRQKISKYSTVGGEMSVNILNNILDCKVLSLSEKWNDISLIINIFWMNIAKNNKQTWFSYEWDQITVLIQNNLGEWSFLIIYRLIIRSSCTRRRTSTCSMSRIVCVRSSCWQRRFLLATILNSIVNGRIEHFYRNKLNIKRFTRYNLYSYFYTYEDRLRSNS